MLVLGRKEGERILIGDDIVLTISKVNGNRVAIGIEAPREVSILRGEIEERRSAENKSSLTPTPMTIPMDEGRVVSLASQRHS